MVPAVSCGVVDEVGFRGRSSRRALRAQDLTSGESPDAPVVAVDLDEVLFPLSQELIRRHNARTGAAYTVADFVTYAFSDVWGHTYAESVDVVYSCIRTLDVAVAPLEHAIDSLSRLSRHFKLVVVTSRDRQLQPCTQGWLDAHFPGVFSDVVFAGNQHTQLGHESKGEVCTRLKASWIVDDSADFAAECAAAGIRAILFGDYPWNRLAEPAPGVQRAEGWPNVVELLLPHTDEEGVRSTVVSRESAERA